MLSAFKKVKPILEVRELQGRRNLSGALGTSRDASVPC